MQLCGDSNVVCKWINGAFAQGTKVQRDRLENSKDLTLMVEEKSCRAISDIDNFVKLVYREHNQEADHWSNIGALGRRKWIFLQKR